MRVVMDDAGDVPPEMVEAFNIYVVPVNISFGTEEFLSNVTLDREVLTITVSEKLSGTLASAAIAGKELAEQGKFYLFDSKAGSAAQGYMVLETARMAIDGVDINTIIHRLEQMRRDMVVGFTIDSLEYARKGGRVSNVKSIMASMLHIKPILRLEDGVIVEAGRVRTRRKAINHILDYVYEHVGNRRVNWA